MRIDILTLFPEIFTSPLQYSILKRAVETGFLKINLYNFREHTTDRHRTVDDYPYGGGVGMVLKPEPIFKAVEEIKNNLQKEGPEEVPVILLTPQGRVFNQQIARELSDRKHLILICGHYEGVDERIRKHLATDEISIGDYVLTGGEPAALVLIDAVVRLISGVLGDIKSTAQESHSSFLIEYPQYTRPQEYRGLKVPEILLSGSHMKIDRWRYKQSLWRTYKRRPDLLQKHQLSDTDKELIKFWECGGEFTG